MIFYLYEIDNFMPNDWYFSLLIKYCNVDIPPD